MTRSPWPPLIGGAVLCCLSTGAPAQSTPTDDAPALPEVSVSGGAAGTLRRPSAATVESATREDVDLRVNATDSEDALKYLPSLLVRKRYIGDYNHAILSTRASGTGNSARSAVYADGILLSNYLGNGIANGTNYAPRWSLVTPEEIERVDVLYGPFSAAYPGNSAGAVVDYVTRMPSRLEAHVSAGYQSQPNDLYGDRRTYASWQTSAALGSRSGAWAWWLDFSRSDSRSQPLTFATATVAAGTPGAAGVPVTGAVSGRSTTNAPWYVLGAGTQYHTVQDHAKLKLAYDFSPTLRAGYVLGWWQNQAQGRAVSYLRGPDGQPVYSGAVNIDGRGYTLAPTALGLTDDAQTHVMHGFSLKRHAGGTFDWELSASLYDYVRDRQRAPTTELPGAGAGGPGTLQSQDGTGWNTLAARGTWRPQGASGAHVLDFGAGRDAWRLDILKTGVAGDWRSGPADPAALVSDVGGRARTFYAWGQDTWRLAPRLTATLGLRWERWRASDGFTRTAAGGSQDYAARHDAGLSPKATLAWRWDSDTVLKASLGRALRFPTVGELYGATSGGALSFINDPNLKPERSWTTELSLERAVGEGLARASWFHESTRDALYSQPIAGTTVSRVQNIDHVRTWGVELAYAGPLAAVPGLDAGGSLTYAHSLIAANAGYPASVGKWQPRVPRWRATAYATWQPPALEGRWAFTVAARYSGRQYAALDNSDVNGGTYMGASKYFTVDLRVRWRISRQLTAAFGIDNANDCRYWNFHPYPQRTYSASLRWDL